MLGLFTQAEESAAPARRVPAPQRSLPARPLAVDRERTSEDAARPTGPLSATAGAANVAQSAAPPAPAPISTYRNDLAQVIPQGLMDSGTTTSLAQVPADLPFTSYTPAPQVTSVSASASSADDDLPLYSLTDPDASQPKAKKSSAGLWVGLGFLGAAAVGGLAVALSRRRQ